MNFSVQNLPFTEPMLAVWAQLVSLAGSKLEKQRMKKSLSRGLTGTQTHTEVADLMVSPDLDYGSDLVFSFWSLPQGSH